jgi:hypothetical protein
MGILTDAEKQELWNLWAEALTDSCVVTSPARPGETAAVQTLPCAVTPFSGFQSDQGGGGDTLIRGADATIWFPRGTTIQRASTIAVNGKSYEAGDVSEPGTYDPAVSVSVIWKRP